MALQYKAKHRPPGYLQDVLAHGTLSGDRLTLSDEVYATLCAKYRVARQVSRPQPLNPATELAKRRFEVCKTCDQAKDQAFACKLHKGCCFGRWRSRPASQCPATPPRWLAESPPHGP